MAELKIRSAVVDLKYIGKKKEFCLYSVIKNGTVLDMSHNKTKQEEEHYKIWKKNVISNWHMTDVACFHRAAIMGFLLTLPEHRGPCISLKDHWSQ